MKTYRFRLKPLAAWSTPWQSDTIFGSLCWELRKLQGEDSLRQFLRRYEEGQPPFVLSDALPEGWFPLPLCARLQDLPRLNFKARSPEWISEEQFRALIRQPGPILPQPSWPEPISSTRELHAAIDRSTNTTGGGGNLFELQEWFLTPGISPAHSHLALYVRTDDSLDLAGTLLRSLASSGYGKKKTIGRGAFEVVGKPEACEWLDETAGADGFVSLSHFIPGRKDPTEGAWTLLTKYPKYAAGAPAPGAFKGRLTMFRPGSVFRIAGPIAGFYGRVLKNLHEGFPEPVHYALAFPVPICWPKGPAAA
jgi:CRISPR-associated protein Csm4